jgi:hypothetical protein
MISKVLNFALVMAIVFFTVPVAFHYDLTLIQSAAITFVAKVLLSPEAPEIYLINGNDKEEDAE